MIGSLPLFCFTRVQDGCSLVHFHLNPLPNEPAGNHSLAADDLHGSAIQPFVWPALPASSPYPDVSEEIGPQGIDFLAIAIGFHEPDERARTIESSGCEGSLDSRRSLARCR